MDEATQATLKRLKKEGYTPAIEHQATKFLVDSANTREATKRLMEWIPQRIEKYWYLRDMDLSCINFKSLSEYIIDGVLKEIHTDPWCIAQKYGINIYNATDLLDNEGINTEFIDDYAELMESLDEYHALTHS